MALKLAPGGAPVFALLRNRVYFPFSFSWASLSAVVKASAAGTFTSGATPVPSQFVFEMGLMALANGTPIMK